VAVTRNTAGVISGITLRNPWGFAGAGHEGPSNDGLVTVTPRQILDRIGHVDWGRV
jgi:hypothetical protein